MECEEEGIVRQTGKAARLVVWIDDGSVRMESVRYRIPHLDDEEDGGHKSGKPRAPPPASSSPGLVKTHVPHAFLYERDVIEHNTSYSRWLANQTTARVARDGRTFQTRSERRRRKG